MEATEFFERAMAQYRKRCPKLKDAEVFGLAELLWRDGKADRDLNDLTTPEDLADEDMSYWDDDE